MALVANSTNYLLKNLEPGVIYRFQLVALLESDELSCSNFKKGKTIGWNPVSMQREELPSFFAR